MKHKYTRSVLISCLLCLVPIVMSAIFYSRLPQQVPVHWDAAGNINGYAPRLFAAFGIPGIMLVINAFTWFWILHDPKRENASKAVRAIGLWMIPILSILVQGIILYNAIAEPFNFYTILTLAMGILFIVLGNYLPKCKQNFTVGIKLPWTLNSEENWNRTHKLAGYLWVVCGFLMMVTSFFQSAAWMMLVILIPMVLIPTVYSFVLYKKGV